MGVRETGYQRECSRCGESFRARRSDTQFCSSRCYDASWAERNAARRREARRAWAERHPEWVRPHSEEHRARMREHRRRWEAKNPEAVRRRNMLGAHRRRIRMAGVASVPFTFEQVLARFAMFGDRCWMCGVAGVDLHMDHVKPVARGGPHMLSNIRPACKPCNSRKSDRWSGVKGIRDYSLAGLAG